MNYIQVIRMFVSIALNYGTLVEYSTVAESKNVYIRNMHDVRKTISRLMDRTNAKCAVVSIWRDAEFCSVTVEFFTENHLDWAENPTFHTIDYSTMGNRMDRYTLLVRRD